MLHLSSLSLTVETKTLKPISHLKSITSSIEYSLNFRFERAIFDEFYKTF